MHADTNPVKKTFRKRIIIAVVLIVLLSLIPEIGFIGVGIGILYLVYAFIESKAVYNPSLKQEKEKPKTAWQKLKRFLTSKLVLIISIFISIALVVLAPGIFYYAAVALLLWLFHVYNKKRIRNWLDAGCRFPQSLFYYHTRKRPFYAGGVGLIVTFFLLMALASLASSHNVYNKASPPTSIKEYIKTQGIVLLLASFLTPLLFMGYWFISIAKRNPDNEAVAAYEQETVNTTPHARDVIKALAESDNERWVFLEKDGKMMVAAEKKQKA